MENYKCEFCGKILKNKYILKTHKMRTKSCLEIQKKNTENVENDLEKCEFCYKLFASNNFIRHMETCKIKKNYEKDNYQKIIIDLRKQLEEKDKIIAEKDIKILEKNRTIKDKNRTIKELKDISKQDHETITEIAKQTKVTKITNNTINNKILNMAPIDLSVDRIKDVLNLKFDHNYIASGQKGVAEFARENLLKDDEGNLNYVCTDVDRKIFKYKDPFGEVHKDTKAKKLRNRLVQAGIKEKNEKASVKWWTNDDGEEINERKFLAVKMAEINNLENDDSIFVKELSAITAP